GRSLFVRCSGCLIEVAEQDERSGYGSSHPSDFTPAAIVAGREESLMPQAFPSASTSGRPFTHRPARSTSFGWGGIREVRAPRRNLPERSCGRSEPVLISPDPRARDGSRAPASRLSREGHPVSTGDWV